MRSRLLILAVTLVAVGAVRAADAKVFYAKSEALSAAFPDADRVDSRTLVLTDQQAAAIEELAKTPIETKLLTLYTGIKDEQVVGYALIDIHTVRTLPEAFLIVLSPEGAVETLRLLAFYEPEEYLPADGWLAQFEDRRLDPSLRLGGAIHGIAGSTLSSQAVTAAVRRSLAIYEIVVSPLRNPTPIGQGGR